VKTFGTVDIKRGFLTLALDAGEESALRSACFAPEEKPQFTRCTGGWVCPESIWTQCYEKCLCFCRESKSDRPTRSQWLL